MPPKSIQAERNEDQLDLFASAGDVDVYVDKALEEVLKCRERGRHLFPSLRSARLSFIQEPDGTLRRDLPCECCGLAVRVEFWDRIKVGGHWRYRPFAARTEYRKGPNGESYNMPSGLGRATPKMIRESLMTVAMKGVRLETVVVKAKGA